MSAATDNRKFTGTGAQMGRADIRRHYVGPVAASALLKVGCLVGAAFADTAKHPGLLDYIADGSMRCLGFCTLGADNTGGALGARTGRVIAETGVLEDANSGGGSAIAATDVGKPAYGVDNQTCSKLSAAGPCIGMITGIDDDTGKPVVLVDPMLADILTGRAMAAGSVLAASLKTFKSTEQTGTGSAQNIAHGLAVTPGLVIVYPTDTSPATIGVYTMTEGAHDATNVVVTVTSGKKFKVVAFA